MAARINVPKICELSFVGGQFVTRTTDDVKKEILRDEVIDFTKRFFSIRDDAGENEDAREFFERRGEQPCNFSLVRDAIQGPSRAKAVKALDTGYSVPERPANVDPARFHREAAAL